MTFQIDYHSRLEQEKEDAWREYDEKNIMDNIGNLLSDTKHILRILEAVENSPKFKDSFSPNELETIDQSNQELEAIKIELEKMEKEASLDTLLKIQTRLNEIVISVHQNHKFADEMRSLLNCKN